MVPTLALLAVGGCGVVGNESITSISDVPGTAEHAVQIGGNSRSFLLHVPPRRPRRLGRAAAYSLVIVLHGSGAEGETVRKMSQMDGLSDSARFLVAYPNGSKGPLGFRSDWNAGECCGSAEGRNVDDVAFVRALVENVATRMPVDRDRIYVAGFSDGGRMTYRLACEMSEQVAAIAVVAGSLADAHCQTRRPVPLIAFHGTGDRDVSYGDSSYTAPRQPPLPASVGAPPAVRFWSAENACKGASFKRHAAHVVQTQFEGCKADVVLYTIESGLHAWPGGRSDGQEPTTEVSASAEAVRFFASHTPH